MALELILAAVIGYLIGSIPFGLILTKLAGLGDVREIGSGNIGATNVLRTGNKVVAFLTLVGDIFKGFAPVLIFSLYFELIPHGLLAGMAALIGHNFPLWLKFRGGKGVATYIGATFGFSYVMGFVFIGVWLLMALIFRYSSLSALVASLVTPLVAALYFDEIIAIALFLMSLLVIIRHRGNIERLLTGREDKIGQKSG